MPSKDDRWKAYKKVKTTKRGKLNKDERAYIKHYCERLTDEEMAQKLNRNVNTITNYRIEYLGRGSDVTEDKALEVKLRHELHRRSEWTSRQNEFTPDELKIFEETYLNMVKQFQDDITSSEDEQIFQAIELKILMHRNKRSRFSALDANKDLRQLIEEEKQKPKKNEALILDMEREIMANESQLQQADKSYIALSDRFSGILKDLKSTRQQRIIKLEESKETIFKLLRDLENRETRINVGFDAEANRVAMEKEKLRLAKPHMYDDKTVDRPLLSSDTVVLDEENHVSELQESSV